VICRTCDGWVEHSRTCDV